KWYFLFGMFLGVIIGFILSITIADTSIWGKYLSAMQIQTEICFQKIPGTTASELLSLEGRHKIVEGVNLANILYLPNSDSSIQSIVRRFFAFQLSKNVLLVSLLTTLVIISIFLFKHRLKNISTNIVFLTGVGLVFLSEFFLPASRGSYCNIIWLPVLSLIVINSDSINSLFNKRLVFLLIAGLVSTISFSWMPGSINILFGQVFIVIYSLFTIFSFIKSFNNNKLELNS
ncbi:MAG: hypothetical protein OEV44_12695, partial [Spirochaetota bacterium]|nr:hypothetical protein [Spirochaetota bacterium]